MSSPAENLRSRLARYAYASPTPSPRRAGADAQRREPVSPSPRRGNAAATGPNGEDTRASRRDAGDSDDGDYVDTDAADAADVGDEPRRTPKRRADGSLEKFGWKKPRRYAEPETYAHLPNVNDCLGGQLRLIFVGINPGKMSSKTGHHFAHPTNKFWRAMYMGGLTRRQLTPAEDVTLPAEYGYGMTNLVDRPTAEQAELAGGEMRAAVPALVRKLAGERARVACFVGKKIWDIFESVAGRAAREREREAARRLSTEARARLQAQKKEERERARIRRDVARQADAPTTGVVAFTLREGEVVKLEPEVEEAAASAGVETETVVESKAAKPAPSELEAADDVSEDAMAQPSVECEPQTPSKPLTPLPSLKSITPSMAVTPKHEPETPDRSSSHLPSPSPPLVALGDDTATPPAASPSSSPFFRAVPHSTFAFDAPQRIRLVLPPVVSDDGTHADESPSYTYFWVVPNTSGLERTPLPRQGALFGRLREFLESLEDGQHPAGEFVDVTVDEV